MTVVKKVIKALEQDGWILISQKGLYIVPNHKGNIPKGTLSQIVKSTGIKL